MCHDLKPVQIYLNVFLSVSFHTVLLLGAVSTLFEWTDLSRVKCVCGCSSGCTCVLGDLSFGYHLFALRIHKLAVFVLFETL